MELVDGLDLERVARRDHPLSVADACEVIRQAAVGLQYVHDRGLVIKPSNLMLTRHRLVKILDLGLAKLQPALGSTGELTGTHDAMGKLHYMAPEQIAESRNVDIRADIYSLGCTLYKLLTGHSPLAIAVINAP
jgi:serine/threonine protein kinase